MIGGFQEALNRMTTMIERWLQDLKIILYLKKGKKNRSAVKLLLAGNTHRLKRGRRSRGLGMIKSVDKTLSLNGGMRSRGLITSRLVEGEKIDPI